MKTAEEVGRVLQQVEFSNGNATLVVGPAGLVLCNGFDLQPSIADLLQSMLQSDASAKGLFLRLIALHAEVDGAEVLACLDEGDRVAILSLSSTTCTVVTEDATTEIDPLDRSFVMERVISGRLVRFDVGVPDPAAIRFRSIGGVLPVGTCSVRFVDCEVAAQLSVVDPNGTLDPFDTLDPIDPIESVDEPQEVVEETEHESDESDEADVHDAVDYLDEDAIYDEEDDALTVWPAAGWKPPIDVSAAPSPERDLRTSPDSELAQISAELNREVVHIQEVPPPQLRTAPAKETIVTPKSAQDSWQPPVWVPATSAAAVSVDPNVVSPQAVVPLVSDPLISWSSAGERVAEVDDSELTVIESGSPVSTNRVSFTPLTPSSEEVLGTFCTNNHFTDSRRLRCLFCEAETQFDRIETGLRPKLGRLLFDNDQVVHLQHNVLIGRKPTAPEGVVADVVSIDDDRLLSRLHLEVRLIDWDIVVVDRQSANGTSIVHPDGRRVTTRPNVEVPLESGSTVHFGRHSFVFEGLVSQ
jgi:hypothetical protein